MRNKNLCNSCKYKMEIKNPRFSHFSFYCLNFRKFFMSPHKQCKAYVPVNNEYKQGKGG